MGWLDRVLGRSVPPPPSLDALFAVPGAALTLESALGLRPTGRGSVSFRAAEGGASTATVDEIQALLAIGTGPEVERSVDPFGYTWLLVSRDPSDLAGLVTDLHAVNATLQDNGFGPSLLCSLVGLADGSGRRVGLVYLYKRSTFYPFAPTGEQQRDSAFELQVRSALGADLPVEPDLSRWFPVWGAPGL
ncbi:MAG: PspA-associated protein PspAB [Actinomycetes bacterium]